ncbi:MAG: hypothetical protein WAV31_00220 [Candidatus Moraniibacteriota bacterium]
MFFVADFAKIMCSFLAVVVIITYCFFILTICIFAKKVAEKTNLFQAILAITVATLLVSVYPILLEKLLVYYFGFDDFGKFRQFIRLWIEAWIMSATVRAEIFFWLHSLLHFVPFCFLVFIVAKIIRFLSLVRLKEKEFEEEWSLIEQFFIIIIALLAFTAGLGTIIGVVYC